MTDQYAETEDVTQSTGLSNKAEVKKRKSKSQIAHDERRDTLRGIMTIPQGRSFMFWLLAACQKDQLPLQYPAQGQPVDTHATMFNIGKMSIGNLLTAECLAAAPDEYLKMIREAKERENA